MNEDNEHSMTESYNEISDLIENNSNHKNDSSNIQNIYHGNYYNISYNVNSSGDHKDDIYEKNTKRPRSLVCDKSFPYNLEGTVSKDGDMTHFVAENLEYKIKLSSPITKKDVHQPCSSKNSTPIASLPSLLPHNFLCSQLSQIDSNVLNDIELEAQYLAASVDNLTENLCNLLHSVSSITADNIEIHKNAVNKLTDCMDANIKCMYTIMAKTEEISKSMKPTEQLAVKIREIKKLVDMLESNL